MEKEHCCNHTGNHHTSCHPSLIPQPSSIPNEVATSFVSGTMDYFSCEKVGKRVLIDNQIFNNSLCMFVMACPKKESCLEVMIFCTEIFESVCASVCDSEL